MHGFTDALRICKMINCGRCVLDYKFIFALGERAYSTLPYSEILWRILKLAGERRVPKSGVGNLAFFFKTLDYKQVDTEACIFLGEWVRG